MLAILNTGSCQKASKSYCNLSAMQDQAQKRRLIKINKPATTGKQNSCIENKANVHNSFRERATLSKEISVSNDRSNTPDGILCDEDFIPYF